MKKAKLLFLALAATGFMQAQIPVTDASTQGQLGALNKSSASTYSKIAEQVVNAAKQLTQLEKTYNTIKSTADKIEKVNEAVQSYNAIEKYITKQKEIISNISQASGSKRNTLNRKLLQSVLNSSSESIQKIQDYLTSGKFNLTDKDRIDLIEAENQRLSMNVIRSRMYLNSTK